MMHDAFMQVKFFLFMLRGHEDPKQLLRLFEVQITLKEAMRRFGSISSISIRFKLVTLLNEISTVIESSYLQSCAVFKGYTCNYFKLCVFVSKT